MGPPCLIPLERVNKPVMSPLTRIEILEEEMQDMMRLVNSFGKLKKERACLMKDH